MIVKTDFVTNSSSSSFIVASPDRISFRVCKKNIMWIEKARQVWKDAKEQRPAKLTKDNENLIEQIITTVSTGYFVGYPSYSVIKSQFATQYNIDSNDLNNPDHPLFKTFLNHYKRKKLVAAYKYCKNFLEENEGNYIYFFQYSDEDGRFFSEMEHGDTFEKFNHLKISNH